jgi:N-acetylneuraminic acid mutarotase
MMQNMNGEMSRKIHILFCITLLLNVSICSQSPWTQLANYGGAARANDVGFSIGHYGFVGCGNNSSGYLHDFWKYDVYTNTWSSIPNYPGQGQLVCASVMST